MQGLSQLLPVSKAQFSGEEQLCVNMRNVHNALDVQSRYNDWISRRINQYGFEEHVDYEVLLNSEYNSVGGRPQTDYYFTLDAAKEIAMVENNERGREIRKYFIACEKQLRKTEMYAPRTYLEALEQCVALEKARLAERAEKEKAQLEAQAARTALSQKSAALAELLNDWGEGETFHSVIAESKRIRKYYNVKYATDPGDSVYKQLGKLMTMLCNGGYSSTGSSLIKDDRFTGHGFPWKKESHPSAMFNSWNVYHIDAWAYLYEVIERDGAASLPYVGKFAK